MSRAWAALALVALAGCGTPERRTVVVAPSPEPDLAAAVFGGPSNVADLNTASDVEAVRILSEEFRLNEGERLLRGWTAPQTRGAPPDFRPHEEGIAFGAQVAAASEDVTVLSSVLTTTETYGRGSSACLFSPGILVRFWVDGPIDVLICFKCAELAAFRGGRRLGPLTSFGPGYWAVLDAVRRVFPDDEALRELAEKRR